MNPKSLSITAIALAALAAAFFAPPTSRGQAGEDPAVAVLLAEVTAQQIILADHQAKIEVKLASIGENLRLARIYAGRSR